MVDSITNILNFNTVSHILIFLCRRSEIETFGEKKLIFFKNLVCFTQFPLILINRHKVVFHILGLKKVFFQ